MRDTWKPTHRKARDRGSLAKGKGHGNDRDQYTGHEMMNQILGIFESIERRGDLASYVRECEQMIQMKGTDTSRRDHCRPNKAWCRGLNRVWCTKVQAHL